MILLINGTELNIKNAYTERDTTNNKLCLIIDVPYGEAEYGALKAIFKTNTEDIVTVTDNGETEVFSGFSYTAALPPIDMEENQFYRFTLPGNEDTYQLTRNRELERRLKDKEEKISILNNIVAEKNKTIAEHVSIIETKTAELDATTKQLLTMTEQCEALILKLSGNNNTSEDNTPASATTENEVI